VTIILALGINAAGFPQISSAVDDICLKRKSTRDVVRIGINKSEGHKSFDRTVTL